MPRYLAYQGTYLQQTFGTAVGSPVSVTVANLVMKDVEEWAFESYPTPPPSTVHSLTNSDAMTSALAEHAMDTMHKIAWEDAEVLASNPRPYQQCAAKVWHIWSQPLPMNREASLLPLFTMDWSTDFLKVSCSLSVYMFVLVVYVSNCCTLLFYACI